MENQVRVIHASIIWKSDASTHDVIFAIGSYYDDMDDDDIFYWLDNEEQAVPGFTNGEWTITEITAYNK